MFKPKEVDISHLFILLRFKTSFFLNVFNNNIKNVNVVMNQLYKISV